eukprot:SAG11_NODE_521_length_8777_cov_17.940770_2_plen_85_part_00
MAMHKLRGPQNTKNERNCSRFSNFEVVYEYLCTSKEVPIPTSSVPHEVVPTRSYLRRPTYSSIVYYQYVCYQYCWILLDTSGYF